MPHDQPVLQVTTSDGHQFELIDCGDSSCRYTLLFLPGLGISARHLIRFGRALAEHNIRALIHEWRGAGSSSLRASRTCNWGYQELLNQDLAAALDCVVEITDGPIWIGGHSLGSQLASLMAALQPERIRGLTIVAGGTPHWRAFTGLMRIKILIAAGFFSGLSIIVGHLPGKRLGFGGQEARSVMTNWCRTILSGRYRQPDRDANGQPVELEQALAALDLPVLSLRMCDDGWVPQRCLDILLSKMPDSKITQRQLTAEQLGRTADHFGWMQAPENPACVIGNWIQQNDTSRDLR